MSSHRRLALALAATIACSAPASTYGGPATNASAAAGAPSAPAAASRSIAAAGGPGFRQVVTASRVSEYAVVYQIAERFGRDSFTGEQSWFAKPPKARFDYSSDVAGQGTTVSLYVLIDGTFLCYQDAAQTLCLGTSGLSTALQQNLAASVQGTLAEHPERFEGTLVETPQIAGHQAYCYDVRALTPQVSGLTNGRFCYSTQGIPLRSQFKTQGGELSMEATRVSTTVQDSDFALPAIPTTVGGP